MSIPLTAAFVVLRWSVACGHRLSCFVAAGTEFTKPARATRGLPVRPGPGYDGQFYYRLALDPFDLSRSAFGIRFDTLSRVERIGYPFIAWLLAAGRHQDVPLTLVLTNVLAAAALGLAGGILAISAGRHAMWGLVFPGYWGYLWTLGRDLTELTAAAFFLFALAALVRRAPVWSGFALLGAVLCKETTLVFVLALAVWSIWQRRHERQRRVERADAVFAIPLLGALAWQLALRSLIGSTPVLHSGQANLGAPFVGLVHGMAHYGGLLPTVAALLWWGELCALVLVTVGAASNAARTPSVLRYLWVFALALGVFASSGIWLGDVGFRSLDTIYLTGWTLLLFGRRPLWPWAAVSITAWCVVAVELIRFL